MKRLLIATRIFNKKKISDIINKFINENESIVIDKINKKYNLNTYYINKTEIIKKILKETKNINLDNSDNLSKDKQKQILNKIIKEVETNSKKLQEKYNDQILKKIDEMTDNSNVTLSHGVIYTIVIQMMDFIQMYITNSQILIDDSVISDKLKYYIDAEIQKAQSEQKEPEQSEPESEPQEENVVDSKIFNIEYSETPETKAAFDELNQIMENANPFSITNVKTPQVANNNFRLRKLANKNILAVQDLFAYLRNNGFDINIAQNGMVATYYEGFNPFILNGLADTILYYDTTTTAKINSRLKKLAEGEGLPAPDPQLALPAGNLESGYYIITEGPGHHKENSFEEAEKWLINNRKDVVVREVINNSYITGNIWEEHEKKIYEKINDVRYQDGPKSDATFRVVEITIPNDQTFIQAYNDWLNKYKNLFKAYDN